MDLNERLSDVGKRPHAYGLTTFGEVAAFVNGVDAATDWKFLAGFREWLASRSGLGESLAWPVLIVKMAYPAEASDFWRTASRNVSSAAVATLFDELELFLMTRRRHGSE